MQIVREDLRGCIGRIERGLPEFRYYVIQAPVSETGVCIEFKTEENAARYIEQHKEPLGRTR